MSDEDSGSEREGSPGAGLSAPWEAEEAGDDEATDQPTHGVELTRWDRISFLVPRFLALVIFVGIPATIAYSFFVGYFQLDPLFQIIGLLGFAYLVRWALRPHLDRYFTHPAERDQLD